VQDDAFTNETNAIYDLLAETINGPNDFGVHERGFAKIIPVGSDTFKCSMTWLCSSLNNINVKYYLVNSNGSVNFTNNGSAGVHIFGSSLRKGPFAGPYLDTAANTVTGLSGQTGSKLIVAGLNPEGIIKVGQRFEIVNRFNNVNSSYFERSEFKRTTQEIKVHREGYAVLEFDPPIRNAPETDRSFVTGSHLGETMYNPVIFTQPELKARLLAGTIQYVDKPLMATDIVFEVMEDMTE
jgi:hypothetical protein